MFVKLMISVRFVLVLLSSGTVLFHAWCYWECDFLMLKKYSTEAGIRISNIYLPQWNHQNPLNQHKSNDLMWKLATGSATSCCFCEPFHPRVSEVDSSIFESGQSSFSKSRILVKNQSSMANSLDPDETAHYEPSHQTLHCLQNLAFIHKD